MAPVDFSTFQYNMVVKLPDLDRKAPKQGSAVNAKGADSKCSSVPENSTGIPIHSVRFTRAVVSFRSIHNSHSLTNNLYRWRNISLPIPTLPSRSVLLLLRAQELPLEQHPARNNEDRHRADNRYHTPRSRLVARVEDAFAGDS
jgi:hypothetical protein